MAERVDVCIVGLGLRRLDRRLAAGRALPGGRAPTRRTSSCSSAASASSTPTSSSRCTSTTSRTSTPDPVARRGRAPRSSSRTASAAARTCTSRPPPRAARDVRAPRPPSGRRARAADVAEARSPASRWTRSTAGPSARCACSARRWNQVSKSGGLWAATLDAAGHTCDRVPLRDRPRAAAQNVKWCHTGCIFGAKNTVNTNYLGAAEDAGVRGAAHREVQSVAPLDRRRLSLRRRPSRCSTGRATSRAAQPTGATRRSSARS